MIDFIEKNNEIEIKPIVEKPKNPKTKWAVTGLYLFYPEVFDVIPKMKPSKRKELEITDVNNWYINKKNMEICKIQGFWHDAGTPKGIREIESFLAN